MRAFVCNILPKSLITKVGAPQAPNNFCLNLIEGGCFNDVCSIVPMSYYHNDICNTDSIKYYQGRKDVSKGGKYISLLFANIRCAWDLRKSDSVWFYNICNTHFLAFILLRYVFFRKVFVILLDYTPTNKRNISHYYPVFYRHSHGLISLSMRTNISHANMDYKAGVIPLYKIKENVVSPHDRLCFLFSGAITNHTGFPMAFNVFKSLPDVDLFVSGFGNISGYNIEDYPNIHYLGYLDYDEYLKLYDKVDVCLSLRDPDFPENANNFPSKILEYFSYNKIVISTINYPELAGFRYVKSEYKEDALCEIVMELSSGNKQDLIELSDNREALKLNFSVESWMESFNKIELNAKKD